MKNRIQLMNATTPLRQLFNRSLRRHGSLLVALVFAVACLALAPCARATCEQGCDTTHNNTFLGNDALLANTTGTLNTATGGYALAGNTDGFDNTASGFDALYKNTDGSYNTADGAYALELNTTGSFNTASGDGALTFNTTGSYNTATGDSALFLNTTGYRNTASGNTALLSNTTGFFNTASGDGALYFNTTGSNNTASGLSALFSNTTGSNNTASGVAALGANTIGGSNSASGFQALQSNTTGSNNIALGSLAGGNLTTGSNNIDIGNAGVAGEANKIRIGTKGTSKATFIAGISGVTVAGGVGVIVDTNGHLGTVVSSARFKDAIKPMDKASEAILSLQPVTFRYKHELDPDGIPQFGLVAEQVEKINPDLVARDEQGKPYTVRYEAVNAMLLNEFLKEHRKVEEQVRINQQQQATIAELKSQLLALSATVKEQAAQIQKVSAQMSMTRLAPRLVVDNQ
jgi:hypothetical protein